MSFYVIVNVGTEKAYKKPGHYTEMRYETERAAKGVCTRLNRAYTGTEMSVADGKNVEQWQVMTLAVYAAKPVKMVERTNMMSGQKYMEAEDTPCFMSPACESYWSA
jgi:hypothetical protein